MVRSLRFAVLALPAAMALWPAAAAQSRDLLNYSIVGWESADVPLNFTKTMQKFAVQKLMLDLAAESRPAAYLDAALEGSGVSRHDLEKLGLVRLRGESYVLGFTLFTASDVRRIHEVSERYAATLAQAILERRADIETTLRSYTAPGADWKAVAFVVLGCFSLDWDGLAFTAMRGYRQTGSERPGGNYVPWAEEKNEVSRRAIYWGSHNAQYREVYVTSFGDHFALPRFSLPDLFWRLPGRATQGDWPDELRPLLAPLVRHSLDHTSRHIGRMMFALREKERTLAELADAAGLQRDEAEVLVALLLELDWVARANGTFRARIPVLDKGDRALVKRLVEIGRRVMDAWLAANYDRLKAELADITPMRYGVPYSDGFTQIWHYVFGLANRRLVEAGLFADPYAEDRRHKGFIPVVWHARVRQQSRWFPWF